MADDPPRCSTASNRRYIGIDFSGSADQWSAGKQKSNIWVAVASSDSEGGLVLETLVTVQQLPGTAHPFQRLIAFLRSEPFAAAAIDAPFSVPSSHIPGGRHAVLIHQIASLPKDGRPFARGEEMIVSLMPEVAPRGRKLWRRTESEWLNRNVNVRSTLWNGPRGGTPFTVACLTLLHRAGVPSWPWSKSGEKCFVEAFPAAQLRYWQLPYAGYSEPKAGAPDVRASILEGLECRGLRCPNDFRTKMLACADALDAAICLYAAKAVAELNLLTAPESIAEAEGWIAVHR